MVGKTVYLLAVLVSIAAVAIASSEPQVKPRPDDLEYYPRANSSHNLSIGNRVPGDRLVLKQSVVKASSWLQIVTEQKTFNISPYERITLVQALDQKTNGNGAWASVLNGGPGRNNVTLRFKSQRSHGINFVVAIYAKP